MPSIILFYFQTFSQLKTKTFTIMVMMFYFNLCTRYSYDTALIVTLIYHGINMDSAICVFLCGHCLWRKIKKKCYDSRANLRLFYKTEGLTYYYMFVLLVREDGSKKEQCARLIRKFIFMRKLAFLSFPIRYWKALKMVIKMRLLWDQKKRQTECERSK